MDEKIFHTCCFFGHRKIDKTEELKNNLSKIIESLITDEKVDTFLFGSNSDFDDLCVKTVGKLKEKYPNIRRIYVRSTYKNISERYKDYLLKEYDDTYFPEKIENSGKASYAERNQKMIDQSKFCVVYYDENYLPPRRKNSKSDFFDYQPKSGTAIAYSYAVKKEKEIINMFEK